MDSELRSCPACGSVIGDIEIHLAWHKEQSSTLETVAQAILNVNGRFENV